MNLVSSLELLFSRPFLRAFFTIAIIVYLVIILWSFANYVMRSLSLYTIAKRRGISNYGFAWVPMAFVWTLGSIADQYDSACGLQHKWRQTLLWLNVAVVAMVTVLYIAFFIFSFSFSVSMETLSEMSRFLPFIWIYAALIAMYVVVGATTIGCWICYYKLFESCNPNAALKYLLLSLFVPFAFPICLLVCRNKDMGIPKENSTCASPQEYPYMTVRTLVPASEISENESQLRQQSEGSL